MPRQVQATQSEKDMLIARIQQFCINDDVDHFTQVEWTDPTLTIPQLKTIILLLNDEVVSMLDANDGRKYHCFLAKELYQYVKYMESLRQNPHNYVTRQRLTLRQKAMIEFLYSRSLKDAFVYGGPSYMSAQEYNYIRQVLTRKYKTRRDRGQHRTAGPPVGALDPLVMERQRHLQVLQRVCRDSEDLLTHKAWNTLTLTELRHTQIITQPIRTPRSRNISQYRGANRPCFLVQSLYRAIRESDTDALNTLVGRPLTEDQKTSISAYYKYYLTEKMVWSKTNPSLTAEERIEYQRLNPSLSKAWVAVTSIGDDVFYEH
jgi:hypothetical protein